MMGRFSNANFFLKLTAFRDISVCRLIALDRHLKGTYCLRHQGTLIMEAVNACETSVNIYGTDYMEQYPTKLSSCSPP
jgi:hypothetical protein